MRRLTMRAVAALVILVLLFPVVEARGAGTAETTLPAAGQPAGAAAIGQMIYVVGGGDGETTPIWRYDTVLDEVHVTDARFPEDRFLPGVASLNGLLYIFSGRCTTDVLGLISETYTCGDIWVLDPASETLERHPASSAMAEHWEGEDNGGFMRAVADPVDRPGCPGGCIYLTGRDYAILRFHPSSQSLEVIAEPDHAWPSLAVHDDALWLVGGVSGGSSKDVRRLDLATGDMEVFEDTLLSQVTDASVFGYGNRIYVGAKFTPFLFFDIQTGLTDLSKLPFPTPVVGPGVARVDDRVWLLGGYVAQQHNVDLIQWLDPTNAAPTASITGPASLLTRDMGTFEGVGEDADGDALAYSWRLGGVEIHDGPVLRHSWTAAGSYEIVLRVTDGEDEAWATHSLQVTAPPSSPAPPPNTPPQADFSAITHFLRVSLDASKSSDEDGDDLTYVWDFGDGSTGSGRTVSHDYSQGGSFTVTLTVSDGEDSASVSRSVSVVEPQPPRARFTLDATEVKPGGSVAADATSTQEGDGENVYRWSLNGNEVSTGKTATFSGDVGEHVVRLVVSTGLGTTDSIEKSFVVKAEPAPAPAADPVQPSEPSTEPTQEAKEASGFLVPLLLVALALARRSLRA